jgi:hypothetical protein
MRTAILSRGAAPGGAGEPGRGGMEGEAGTAVVTQVISPDQQGLVTAHVRRIVAALMQMQASW